MPTVNLKTVAVGYGRAGKTTMFITYTTKEYPSGYVPSVFDNYCVTLNDVNLGLWDTVEGEDGWAARLRPLSYPQTDVFILCFDVARRYLFNLLEDYWYPELRHHCPDVPIVLVGTKTDLRESKSDCVTREEGEKLAEKTNSHYAEICSLRKEGLDELFTKVIELGTEHEAMVQAQIKKKKCIIF